MRQRSCDDPVAGRTQMGEEMKAARAAGRAAGFVMTAVLAVLLLFNLLTIVSRYITGNDHFSVFGITIAVVISGSMEPEISVNDMVVICRQKNYAENEIVTYVSESGALVTHRITGITEDGFITRGDANNTVDGEAPIAKEKIVGKVVFVIPRIGAALGYLQTPLGVTCLTLAGFLILALPYFGEREKRSRTDKEG